MYEPQTSESNVHQEPKIKNPEHAEYKDVFWGVLFVLQILTVIGLACSLGVIAMSSILPKNVTIMNDKNSEVETVEDSNANVTAKVIGGVFMLLFLGLFSSVFMSYGLARASSKLLTFTFVISISITLFISISFLATSSIVFGVLGLIFALFVTIYYRSIKPRLQFAAANLSIASKSVMATPTVFLYTMLILVVQMLWCLVWFVALVGVATNLADPTVNINGEVYPTEVCTTYEYTKTVKIEAEEFSCDYGTCKACVCNQEHGMVSAPGACFKREILYGQAFGMLLSFFWTSSVFSNIVHCTAAGAVASWWFSEHVNKTWAQKSFSRACTTSLGSICLGSLFIACIRTVRWVLSLCSEAFKYPSDNPTINKIKCFFYQVFESFLGLVEQLMVYFSKYGLCYVAVYGDSFSSASKSVATLFSQKGWTALVNDDIVDSLLFCCNISVGLLCLLVAYFYSKAVGLDPTSQGLMTALGFLSGAMMSMIVAKIMSSAVATVFVCFAEDHQALEITHPNEYRSLSDAWIDCNCHPAVCTGMLDGEASSIPEYTKSTSIFPSSYISNRGTYQPPSAYVSVPSQASEDDVPRPWAPSSTAATNNTSNSPNKNSKPVLNLTNPIHAYEQFSRTHSLPGEAAQDNNAGDDEDEEETVAF